MSEEDIVLGIAELTSLEFAHMIRSVCIFLHMSVRSSALHDRRRRRRRRASFPFEGHALFGCALGLSVLKHQPAPTDCAASLHRHRRWAVANGRAGSRHACDAPLARRGFVQVMLNFHPHANMGTTKAQEEYELMVLEIYEGCGSEGTAAAGCALMRLTARGQVCRAAVEAQAQEGAPHVHLPAAAALLARGRRDRLSQRVSPRAPVRLGTAEYHVLT